MRAYLWLLLLTFSVYQAAPVFAETPPVPGRKTDLTTLERSLSEEAREKQDIEARIKNIEQDMADTRKRLVEVAASIQANERTLNGLEGKIGDLQNEKSGLEKELLSDRQSIAQLILALERIRRIPPEALVVKPDIPLKTAQSAMLMRDIVPVIYKKAENLRQTLERLETLTADLARQRKKAGETQESLKAEHSELSELLAAREALYKSTHTDLKAQEEQLQKISRQASTLQELVSRIEEHERRDAERTTERGMARQAAVVMPAAPAGDGFAQLPISGIIKTRYNEPDYLGAPSRGISIEGRAGALIVAPMSGIIRFAGYFKNYGNIVILEHNGGYHSLVAGLEKIDTVVGQSVAAGEPLGILHQSQSGDKPILYYELRHGGKPVDPAKKFTDLG